MLWQNHRIPGDLLWVSSRSRLFLLCMSVIHPVSLCEIPRALPASPGTSAVHSQSWSFFLGETRTLRDYGHGWRAPLQRAGPGFCTFLHTETLDFYAQLTDRNTGWQEVCVCVCAIWTALGYLTSPPAPDRDAGISVSSLIPIGSKAMTEVFGEGRQPIHVYTYTNQYTYDN